MLHCQTISQIMNPFSWIAATLLGEQHRFLGLDWNYLVILGFAAQFIFGARFLVQWIVSERRKQSVVPVSFWYLSISGGILLGLYFAFRRDPVGLIGQLFGTFVYVRNLTIIRRNRQVGARN
jgi:lipid-A-disaccharide synthase-like uncharacterized protein